MVSKTPDISFTHRKVICKFRATTIFLFHSLKKWPLEFIHIPFENPCLRMDVWMQPTCYYIVRRN